MARHKIGWCSKTWNPVVGCKNNCNFCYAKRINDRFKFIRSWNIPEWREKSFNKKFPKKPQRIFVGSMSEIAHWRPKWIERVIEKVKQYPQHTFQFLTKFPDIYLNYSFPKNCWLGITVTGTENYNCYDSGCDDSSIHLAYQKFKISNPDNLKFISFEPLLDEIIINLEGIDWVIIGFQTNPFKKIEKKAVVNIIEYTRENNIPLFLKNSIYKGYPDLPIIKEFPDGR